ncbi:MAG: hypothetical protein IJX54_01760, partial [Oscillospiraceae bacterium]|nr:hypothetical protein [Oscillospiraceae bacterium]
GFAKDQETFDKWSTEVHNQYIYMHKLFDTYNSYEDEGIVSEKVSVDTTIDENRCISITKASIELGSEYEKDEIIVINLIKSKIGDIEVSLSFVEV